jgi:REP element-mobilizing transposase RayT
MQLLTYIFVDKEMPAPRKLFLHDHVYFLTFRTEEGLPFVPLELINELIWSALARAQRHYPVEISAFLVGSNHIHMLIVVKNPADVPLFVGYFKQETAHYINRLLGRRQKSVWCDRYDSPVVLTADKVFHYFTYIFTNPIKDKLVRDIHEYPGASSWDMLLQTRHMRYCSQFPRSSIRPLKNPHNPRVESSTYLSDLKNKFPAQAYVIVDSCGWKRCFRETKHLDDEELKHRIINDIKTATTEIQNQKNYNCLGVKALLQRSLLENYKPKKYSKRTIAISSDIVLRKKFILHFKSMSKKAAKVTQDLKSGIFSFQALPPGFFLPGRAVLASALSWFFYMI